MYRLSVAVAKAEMREHIICETCMLQIDATTDVTPPKACLICEDERQYKGDFYLKSASSSRAVIVCYTLNQYKAGGMAIQ